MAFGVYELHEGVDLNGNGDPSNIVLHLYDAVTGSIDRLHAMPIVLVTPRTTFEGTFAWGGNILGYLAAEGQETADLNGDGDTTDLVLFAASSERDPGAILQALIDDVQSAGLAPFVENILVAWLGLAAAAITAGLDAAAVAILQVFINVVDAVPSFLIPAATADALVQSAEVIVSLLQ